MAITHAKVSSAPEGSDPNEVRASDWNASHVIALEDADIPATIARDTEVATAVSDHAALADPHTVYVLESATPGGELGGTYASPTVDATHSGSTHAAAQAAAEATAASALTTHAATSHGLTAAQVVDLLYPVGSLYVSTLTTNPNTLLGTGTWTAFGAGKVLVGRDSGDADFDTAEETGGAKTVASVGSVSAPTFTGDALSTHAHAAGTLVPSAHAGTAVAAHNVTQPTAHADVLNHLHTLAAGTTTTGNFSQVTTAVDTSSGGTGGSPTQTALHTVSGNPTANGVASQTHTGTAVDAHAVTQPSAHTMSGTSEAVSAGTPAGTNSTPTFTGSPTSVVQPYIVVYMWKRTA